MLVDVGGVLVMPSHAIVSGVSAAHRGRGADGEALYAAHYAGVAAGDAPDGFDWGAYRRCLLASAGVPADRLERAGDALARELAGPAERVWTQVMPGAREGVGALATSGARLAVVSNSDGTVAALLDALCLVPEGTPVVDSGAVGVAKPDPEPFTIALDRLGVPAARAVHVGDVPSTDVAGARAAGVRPLHLDPVGWCRAGDHEHVASLAEVVGRLAT